MKITLSEVEASLGNVTFPLAVAVSGGADSLALLLLTQAYAKEKGGHIIALTVDHGLRPDSKAEAQQVQKWAEIRGIEHVILTWEGEKPTSHLQEKARFARYELLIEWCKKNQVSTLLLGHHREDQEETFWLRLSAGSGLEGLTGMKQETVRDGIRFLRPLLGFPKERLKATLLAENQPWLEDPSNQSENYFRGRFRSFLEEEGLSPSRLTTVMEKLREDADFIQNSLHQAIKETVHLHEEGYITLKRDSFEALHPALQRRLLSFLMKWFSGGAYAPRSAQVMIVLEKILLLSEPAREYLSPCGRGRRAAAGEGKNKEIVRAPHSPLVIPAKAGTQDKQRIPQECSPFLTLLRKFNSVIKKPLGFNSFLGPRLREDDAGGGAPPPFTAGGIYWIPRTNDILLLREKSTIRDTLKLEKLNEKTLWDQRFLIDPSLKDHVPQETILAPLGRVAHLKNEVTSPLPPRVWPTLPALWVEGKVAAIPHLCYNNLLCEKDLSKFISLKPLFHDSLRFTI